MAGPTGSSISVPSASLFSYANRVFTGWNTQSGGGGVTYQAGATFLLGSAPTLYAQWASISPVVVTGSGPTTLVLTFEADGASDVLSPVTLDAGSSIQLPTTSSLSNPGFTFAGWFSAAVGGQALGQGGATLTPISSETVFAQWSAILLATLSFSSNQGSGTVVELTGAVSSVVTVSASKGLSRPGFVFTGWNTVADGSGSSYASGAQFSLHGATTLYAQWSPVPVVKPESFLIGSVGPFANGSTRLTHVLMARIREIALAMRSKDFAGVALYGYDSGSGTTALHMRLSTQRALHVVELLRLDLVRLHVRGVTMSVRGEGETMGFTASMFRRVEIFAN